MKDNLLFIWYYARNYKLRFGVMLISIILTSITGALFPFFLGKMINSLLYERDYGSFLENFFLYGVFFLVQQIMRYINTRQYAALEISFLCDVRQDVLKSYFSMKAEELSVLNRGDAISRIENDTKQILNYIYYNLFYTISDIFEFFSQIVMIALISWKLLILTIICIPISFYTPQLCAKIASKYYQKQYEIKGEFYGWFFDILNNLIDIRLLSGESKVSSDFLNRRAAFVNNRQKITRLETLTQIGIEGNSVIIKIMLYIVSALLVVNKEILIGNFISVIEYFNSSLGIFNDVAKSANRISENMVAIERVRNIVEKNHEKKKMVSKSGECKEIVFENVYFRYGENEVNVINNVSFKINSGEHVVIAGKSGGGKTTLLRLMLKFYMPSDGNIFIGGENLSDENIDLSNKVSVVFQNASVFDGSIRFNLIFSDDLYRDAEIWEVLNRVGLAQKICTLPEGLATKISQQNVFLSGGEIQRIEIARALLRNSEIIIFDEPTSAYDLKSEYDFLDMCQTYYNEKTIIMISHRVDTLKMAKKIIFMCDGAIGGMGTHAELMANCEAYSTYISERDESNE